MIENIGGQQLGQSDYDKSSKIYANNTVSIFKRRIDICDALSNRLNIELLVTFVKSGWVEQTTFKDVQHDTKGRAIHTLNKAIIIKDNGVDHLDEMEHLIKKFEFKKAPKAPRKRKPRKRKPRKKVDND